VAKGFLFSGISAGIKKNKKDLGLIFSQYPAVIAGVTTRNKIYAAPVKYCRKIIANGKAQAILVNSGNANAFTGEKGYNDCLEVADALSGVLAVPGDYVAYTSTGVIGVPLPKDTIKKALSNLKSHLCEDPHDFAEAILTTDLRTKIMSKTIAVDEKQVSFTGISKGSGMIEPNMATMLGFICMDIRITAAALQNILTGIVDDTFNMISVDGDTSTNDMVLAIANGASEVDYEALSEQSKLNFSHTLRELCTYLAKEIVRDGEGVTKVMEITVSGAATKRDARVIIKSIINSPLIKTAIYGADPNWGRFMMAVGKTCIEGISSETISLSMGTFAIVEKGVINSFSREELKKYLQQKEITINISLGLGEESATGWGCDLTEDYIKINTAYN